MSVGTFVGLDIGYGQVKLSWSEGLGRQVQSTVFPSGAAPLSQVDTVGFGSDGEALYGGDGIEVMVGDVPYVALVDPMGLRHGMPTLHKSYTDTPEYTALFHGALASLGTDRIRHLVTGLPVAHFKNKDSALAVKARLIGSHKVTRHKTVHIDKVSILPQGYGAWAWAVDHLPHGDTAQDVLLVVDFGHFSVDWICFVANKFRSDSSNSSIRGGSLILDAVNRELERRYKVQIGSESLFHALTSANGEPYIKIGRDAVPLNPLLDAAAADLAPSVVGEILASMRDQKREVNRIMICGGSAPFFMAEIKRVFNKAGIDEVRQSVLANAHGHRLYAVSYA